MDKRYLTEFDLTATTSTGDPEGEVVERHEAPTEAELERRLALLRGEIDLPIPAASAVKIGGERAYKLARRGTVVEMPLRRSHVYALDVIAYSPESVRLELHVSSGTYIRAIAEVLGGHCRTLRRTAVGPFSVEEAGSDRLLPAAEALGRLPGDALARVPEAIRTGVLGMEAGGPDGGDGSSGLVRPVVGSGKGRPR